MVSGPVLAVPPNFTLRIARYDDTAHAHLAAVLEQVTAFFHSLFKHTFSDHI